MAAYVIYLRKSRADMEAEKRGEGETLARHRAALLEVAKRQGLAVEEVYAEVVSGETVAARPVMQRLLAEVEQGSWSGVLVMEIERLARGDTIDQGIVARAFKFSGTKIITPIKTYDPGNEFDEEYFEFGLFMSRREYKTITRRMQRGRAVSVQEGKFVGSRPPYGYERVRLAGEKGYTLKPVPIQADAVRLIFDWYVNGEAGPDGTRERLGYAKIARKLDALHSPTISGGSWSAATIREILSNPAYIGKVRWNRRPQVKRVTGGRIVRERPRADADAVTVADGLHPPIIARDLFEEAQAYLRRRSESPAPRGRTLKNPLAGIVVCGVCGKAMVRRPYTGGYPDTLVCRTPDCPNISTQLRYVEQSLLDLLEDWLGEYWLEEVSAAPLPGCGELQVKKQAAARLHHDLRKLEMQSESLHDLLEQGVYSFEKFKERSERVAAGIAETRAGIAALDAEAAYEKRARENRVIPEAGDIAAFYRMAGDPKQKNDLLKAVLDRVVYTKTKNGRCRGNAPDAFELEIYPLLPPGKTPY